MAEYVWKKNTIALHFQVKCDISMYLNTKQKKVQENKATYITNGTKIQLTINPCLHFTILTMHEQLLTSRDWRHPGAIPVNPGTLRFMTAIA